MCEHARVTINSLKMFFSSFAKQIGKFRARDKCKDNREHITSSFLFLLCFQAFTLNKIFRQIFLNICLKLNQISVCLRCPCVCLDRIKCKQFLVQNLARVPLNKHLLDYVLEDPCVKDSPEMLLYRTLPVWPRCSLPDE